jgi:two-component system, cell cycle sensor histidine kinase and response regulator CckA
MFSGVVRATRIAFLAMVGALAFEGTKQSVLPSISIWESHILTTLFFTISAFVVSVVMLRREERSRAALLNERLRTDGELLREEATQRSLVQNAPYGIFRATPDGQILSGNPAMCKMLGYAAETELMSVNLQVVVYRDPEERTDIVETLLREGELRNVEGAWRCKDETFVTVRLSAHRCMDAKGRVIFEGFIEDITDRKRSESELRRLSRALSTLSRCSEALVHATDEARLLSQICEIVVQVGGYRLAWVGYAEEDGDKAVRLMAKSGLDDGYVEKAQITWADTERGGGPIGTAIKTGEVCTLRDILQNPQFSPWRADAMRRGYAAIISLPLRDDARLIGALTIYAPEPDAFDNSEVELLKELAAGLAYGITALRTATERRLTEAALHESEERYRMLFARNPHPMWICDVDTLAFLEVNDAAIAHYGYSREEFLRMTVADIRPPENIPGMLATLSTAKSGYTFNGSSRHRKKDGTKIYVDIAAYRFMQHGKLVSLTLANDVTEGKLAERALRESEERFRQVVEGAPVGMFIQTDGLIRYLNPAALAMFGAESIGQIVGQPFLDRIQPGSRAAVKERTRLVTEKRKTAPFLEEQYLQLDGNAFDTEVSAIPFTFKEHDGAVVFFRDITERKREESKSRVLEQRLRQAQKMEAVGRLAGGIAHDFNNLLMVIQSYTEMLQDSIPAHNPLRKNTLEIMKAAERAASLTRQMLAFSRTQIITPVVLDLNAVVNETAKMLKRLIGEDIEFRVDSAQSLWAIEADSDQMVQVLMNLCLNSRDAMPQGGTLTITTENVALEEERIGGKPYLPPGQYVRLSVTDTGAGISKELHERIFEPFFTTKEVGKGTGLGLAMVYGIVKQSGGQVWVDSERGQGACFTIYMPKVMGAITPDVSAKAEARPRGTETLLVVEDEESLREAICDYLRSLGYTVFAASSGQQALLVAGKQEHIDLLVTDVVMPKMSGRELSQVLERLRPGLKTIHMSGYTDDAVLRHGIHEFGTHFLQKPFSLGTLARKVRDTLGPTETVR